MDTFVGREDPVANICAELRVPTRDQRVHIVSISGPGGVGKSFLLDHVLSQLDLSKLQYLPLRINGNTSSVTLADLVVRDLLSTLAPQIAGDPMYFRVTRHCYDVLQWMDAKARVELESETKNDDALASIIGTAYDGVVGILEVVAPSRTRRATRIAKRIRGKDLEKFVAAASHAKAYREERSILGLLQLRRAARERNLLRKDLQGRLAEYLVTDLAAILSGYQAQDWKKYLPRKVAGLEHLLLIVDDYETLAPALDEFLRWELLRRLREKKFTTTVIILGRDSVRDTDFAWDQYYGEEIVLDVRLAPLSDDESEKYLAALGVCDPHARKRIIHDCLGMPFLLAAEAECELRGGASALSLQKFIDRTTRWMTQEQKAWAMALAFLDDVNVDTVQCIVPDANPAEIVEWFKQEASIRSPDSAKWKMLPIIRSRLQAAIQNDSPSQYKAYKEAAAGIPKIQHHGG